jgi:hypothetical protein
LQVSKEKQEAPEKGIVVNGEKQRDKVPLLPMAMALLAIYFRAGVSNFDHDNRPA